MNRTKTVRNLLLSLSLAAGAFAAPAYAQISFNIVVAPPAPQYEVVPVVAHGNVWAPGYWAGPASATSGSRTAHHAARRLSLGA